MSNWPRDSGLYCSLGLKETWTEISLFPTHVSVFYVIGNYLSHFVADIFR